MWAPNLEARKAAKKEGGALVTQVVQDGGAAPRGRWGAKPLMNQPWLVSPEGGQLALPPHMAFVTKSLHQMPELQTANGSCISGGFEEVGDVAVR